MERHRSQENFHLLHLWDNWPMVMGDELCAIAHPLGAKNRTLIIGAEDSMLMHELSFQASQILSLANAFMNEPYFKQLRLELLQKRKPLYPRITVSSCRSSVEKRERPANLGRLVNHIDPESAAGKAYLAYIKSFEEK
jgi:hypothetical protein